MYFRSLRIDSARRSSCTAALTIALATLVASASHAGPGVGYCEIDIKCSVGPDAPQDDYCAVVPVDEVTFYYDFIGGEAEIIDDKFGVIGIYTGTTLTRTETIGTSETHTATFRPIDTVCTTGIFSDSVTVIHGNPTPTASPTATPTTSPTPTATPTPTTPPHCDLHCFLDKTCSVGGSEPQDSCVASAGEEVTYHYFVDTVYGGLPATVRVVDDKLGLIGTTTEAPQTFVRTTTLTETTTNTAALISLEACPCGSGPVTDSVTVAVSPCTDANPMTKIVTIAKGQSPANNPKVSHAITGYIIDPDLLGYTAHRIEVCAGTLVTTVVTDTTGTPTNTAARSLACGSAGCSGVVNAKEKYQSISADGRDKDTITFIPK